MAYLGGLEILARMRAFEFGGVLLCFLIAYACLTIVSPCNKTLKRMICWLCSGNSLRQGCWGWLAAATLRSATPRVMAMTPILNEAGFILT